MDAPASAAPAVSFEHVALAFDDVVVLRDVNFTIADGHMAIVMGPSGGGKSLLLKLILGLVRPDSGVIRIHGVRIDTMSERELMVVRDEIGMLFQEGALFDSLTVEENIGFKLKDGGHLAPDVIRARVEEMLAVTGLREFIDRSPAELSGGQRRRVAVARAMAARPHLLLLDEPTSGLDPITARSVDDAILALRDVEHVTLVLVTHQLEDAFYMAGHEAIATPTGAHIVPAPHRSARDVTFLVLNDGVITFEGGIDALLASDDDYTHASLSGWVPPLHA
ncbi:ABC transporter ATP-binding protein [Luteitalea sp.]|jgi:phospholipid/cholesterol/gamma-HCH transport system ATP-binding protein|uniref:ABC transporter ATP-binding protein n=1 Tax=Luteitalea sp. TaxID=2004800 RepID=UPI0037C69F81